MNMEWVRLWYGWEVIALALTVAYTNISKCYPVIPLNSYQNILANVLLL